MKMVIIVRAKTSVKLQSATVNYDLEFQKGTTLTDVFKNLMYLIQDGETQVAIEKLLAENAQRVNGPDVSDGHDSEGFPGGCARFGCDGSCEKGTRS